MAGGDGQRRGLLRHDTARYSEELAGNPRGLLFVL
jgi:hypothetical protein